MVSGRHELLSSTSFLFFYMDDRLTRMEKDVYSSCYQRITLGDVGRGR